MCLCLLPALSIPQAAKRLAQYCRASAHACNPRLQLATTPPAPAPAIGSFIAGAAMFLGMCAAASGNDDNDGK